MEDIIQKMQGVVRGFCQAEGGNKTGIPFVTAWCFTSEKIQMPKTETGSARKMSVLYKCLRQKPHIFISYLMVCLGFIHPPALWIT